MKNHSASDETIDQLAHLAHYPRIILTDYVVLLVFYYAAGFSLLSASDLCPPIADALSHKKGEHKPFVSINAVKFFCI